jgi:hypothetical protein
MLRFLLQWVQSTSHFQSRLLALNAGYTTNALGQTANAFTGLLATDVLNENFWKNNFSMELMF